MIDNRKKGLLSLQTVLGIVVKLAAFYLLAYLMVYVIGKSRHEFINYPLYTFGIIAASLVAHYRMVNQQLLNEESNRWVRSINRANGETLFMALFLFTIVWATKDKSVSRMMLGIFIMLNWLIAFGNQMLIREHLARLLFRGRNRTRTAFIGSQNSAEHIKDWLGNAEGLGMQIAGVILTDEAQGPISSGMPILGKDTELAKIIDKHGIQQVILLETQTSRQWVESITSTCIHEGCRMLVFNPWQEYFRQALRSVSEAGHTFYTIQKEPLEDPINRILKRGIDIAVALPLTLTLLPACALVTWIMQREQSPGPLLYKQQRSGLFGDTFEIYKFRSMHFRQDNADEAHQATKGDPRIFPFGHVLRKTSMDELPQLLNVLFGQMSLVGPRPHLTNHDSWFREHAGAYKTRHFVKPGITGLAQVRGMRGEVQTPDQIRNRVKLDIQYINTWSLWMDIGILVKTAIILFNPPDEAY